MRELAEENKRKLREGKERELERIHKENEEKAKREGAIKKYLRRQKVKKNCVKSLKTW